MDSNLVGTKAAADARQNQAKMKDGVMNVKGPLKSLNRLMRDQSSRPSKTLQMPQENISSFQRREPGCPLQAGNPIIPWLQEMHGRQLLGRDMDVSLVRNMLQNELARHLDEGSKKGSTMPEGQLQRILSVLGNIPNDSLKKLVDDVVTGHENELFPYEDEDDEPITTENIRNQFDDIRSNLQETYEGDFLARRPDSRGMAAVTNSANRFDQGSSRIGQRDTYEIGGTQSVISDVLADEEYMRDIIAGLQDGSGSQRAHGYVRPQDARRPPNHRRHVMVLCE